MDDEKQKINIQETRDTTVTLSTHMESFAYTPGQSFGLDK